MDGSIDGGEAVKSSVAWPSRWPGGEAVVQGWAVVLGNPRHRLCCGVVGGVADAALVPLQCLARKVGHGLASHRGCALTLKR